MCSSDLQEALTNVAKHAGATFVSLRFHVEPGGCVLEVEDNGSGMNRSSSPGKSFGLTNMQERARMHRGELELLEGQTGGLLVRLTVPIPSQLSGKEPQNAKFSHR